MKMLKIQVTHLMVIISHEKSKTWRAFTIRSNGSASLRGMKWSPHLTNRRSSGSYKRAFYVRRVLEWVGATSSQLWETCTIRTSFIPEISAMRRNFSVILTSLSQTYITASHNFQVCFRISTAWDLRWYWCNLSTSEMQEANIVE